MVSANALTLVGLSIGINLNTNNACNWRCVYCQVPDLSLGSAPDVGFDLLAAELAEFYNPDEWADIFSKAGAK
jgi:wyosine [tRNA(Phe)-imidazoG37] synthetase (radical SAM superfamily)